MAHKIAHAIRETMDDAEIALHYLLEIGHVVHLISYLFH